MPDNLIDNQDGDNFWTGLLVGGILGAAAGFFLGSDNKDDLKRKIKDKALDVWDNLGDFSNSVKDKALDIKDDVVEEAQDVGQQAEEVADIARQKIEAITVSAQQAVEQEVAQVKKAVDNNSGSFRKKFFFHKGRSLHKQVKL